MIKCIIVDDEKPAQESLKGLITQYFNDLTIVGIASSVKEARVLIEQKIPDLVFLDIDMPEENGLELLKNKGVIEYNVIFTTAYEQYAINAIKYSALDYLLKPISLTELKGAVTKAFKAKSTIVNQERFNLLLSNISNNSQQFSKIALPLNDGYEMIKVSDIVYCKADGNYSHVYLINQKQLLVSKTLGWFEELLPSESFFRIHKSYMINLNLIKKYNKLDGNVIMETGEKIDVADRVKKDFLTKILNSN